jgi:Spy/CpxP family protein refolding chaperone
MKRNLLFTASLLALFLLAYTPAFAQAPDDVTINEEAFAADAGPDMAPGMGMGMWGGHGGGATKMMDALELTKDQRKQIQDITFNFRKEVIPMRAQMQVANLELQQLIRSDAKRADIDAKIDQLGKMRTDMQKKAVGMRLALRGVLTPDQRDKWESMRGSMGPGMNGPMKGEMMKRMRERFKNQQGDEKP